MKTDKDLYFIAVKLFLERGGKFLILKDNFGVWDLPGGRLLKTEFSTPLEKVIRRKMREELGNDIKYKIVKPVVFMRHQRIEQIAGRPKVRIFAIGYLARYLSGTIKLSARHIKAIWVSRKTFKPEKYFKGGWLKGVKEYLAK